MPRTRPLKVCFFDAATSPGGTTTLTEIIFSKIDRRLITPRLFSALPTKELASRFKNSDISLPFSMNLTYAERENLLLKLNIKNKFLLKAAVYLISLFQILANIIPFFKILVILKQEKPDIIHIHNFETALLAAYLLKIPVIWHFHGIPAKPGKIHKLLQSIITQYLCISLFVKNQAIKSGYPDEKLLTLLNPAPSIEDAPHQDPRGIYSIPHNSILASNFGRILPWKGQLEFLQAFSIAKASCPQLFALVVGDDGEDYGYNYKEQLTNYIKDNQLSEHVILTGHIEDPHPLMEASDIIVHSSIEPEPFGLVITEAMAHNACVICSNIGAPPEIITHGVTGLVANPQDQQDLANAMIKLCQEPLLRAELSKNAKQEVNLNYDPSNYVKKLESIYISLVN